jgi:hypothetical protein
MLLLLAGLTGVGAVTAKGQCVDAAREGALAAARGEPGAPATAARVAPAGASIAVSAGAEAVTVTVEAPVRLLGGMLPRLTVRAAARAAMEPSAAEPIP